MQVKTTYSKDSINEPTRVLVNPVLYTKEEEDNNVRKDAEETVVSIKPVIQRCVVIKKSFWCHWHYHFSM